MLTISHSGYRLYLNASLLSRVPENLATFYGFHSQLPFIPEKPLWSQGLSTLPLASPAASTGSRDMTRPSAKEDSSPFSLWNGEEGIAVARLLKLRA